MMIVILSDNHKITGGNIISWQILLLITWCSMKIATTQQNTPVTLQEDVDDFGADGLKGACSAQVSTSWGPASSRPTPIKSR